MARPGLILNTSDDWLPADSPWRTREEVRDQEPIFDVDGYPVYEAWFWHVDHQRWFVMSRAPDVRLAMHGVVYFGTLEELRAQLRILDLQSVRAPRAA